MDHRVLGGRVTRALFVLPLSVAAYALVLNLVYVEFVVARFSYIGYRYVEPSWDTVVISWLVTAAVGSFLPVRSRGASSVVLWVLYVVVIAPTVLTLPYMGTMTPGEGLAFGTGLAACFILMSFVVWRRSEPKILGWAASPTTFWLIIGAFSALTYLYLAFTTGISLQFISLLDVYDQRSDYREALAESTLLGYLVSNQANVVNPILIAWGIQRRRWSLVALVILGQFILYTATGFKTVLFSVLAISVILLLFRSSPRPRLLVLMWGATLLVLTSWLIDSLIDSMLLTSMFARRFLFTPARLSGLYFEWYSNNPLSLLANSILRPFTDSPYQYGPARTIAIYATGAADASLNANVFASGFAEFGWYGVIGVAILLGLYLRVIDRAAAGLPSWVGAVVLVMPAVTLSNTALHTAVLSHGLLAAVLVLAILPRQPQDGALSDVGPPGARFRTPKKV